MNRKKEKLLAAKELIKYLSDDEAREILEKIEREELTGYPSIDKTHLNGTGYFDRNPIIPNLSLFNTFKFMAGSFKDKYALDSIGARLTYKDLIDQSIIVSKAFKELGIKQNDIIVSNALLKDIKSKVIATLLDAPSIQEKIKEFCKGEND